MLLLPAPLVKKSLDNYIQAKTGRPPKRAAPGTKVTLTIKITADIKNAMIDQAAAYDLTVTEYITNLVERDGT